LPNETTQSEKVNYEKEISMGRIMSYYYPKWMAYSAVLASIIDSFAFPLYGLIYAKILFIMMMV
jgi:hypothetical protein